MNQLKLDAGASGTAYPRWSVGIIKKLIGAVAKPFTCGDKNVAIGASIGIALYPDHEQVPEALLKRADGAMYEIKNQEKNDFAFASD